MLHQLYQQAIDFINRKAYQQAHQCLLQILQHDRQFADAYYLLATIAGIHHNTVKAIALANKANEIENKTLYLVFLAKQHVLCHDHVNAKHYADEAVNKGELTWQQCDDLGVIYSQIGLHQDAINCFELVLKQVNTSAKLSAQFYLNLAASYKFLGQFEQSIAMYRQALEIAPDNAQALWSLAGLDKRFTNQTNAKRLESLLANTSQINDKLCFAHALARCYEATSDYQQAFKVLQQVKADKKRAIGYDFSADKRIFDAIKQFFSSNHQVQADHDKGEEAIFIVGMPRTGTTIVERLLCQSANVYSAGELQHFAVAFKQLSGVNSASLLDQATIASASTIDWAQLAQRYFDSTKSITNGQGRFIDKMPINFLYVGFILSAMPRAKVICLDKGLEASVISNFRQMFAADFSFYRYNYDLADCIRYYQEFSELTSLWQGLFPNNFYRLDYTSFVREPLTQGRQLFKFIEEPWQDDFINLARDKGAVATASASQVREGIHDKAVNFWQHYQTPLSQILHSDL